MRLLFEIGMEEIPARFLNPALQELKTKFSEHLKTNRINASKINSYGTPRRLILDVHDLDEKQLDLDETNIGPSKEVAYKNGEITKAGIGFAKSQGIDPTDLIITKTDKGEYISARNIKKGELTKNLLPEILKKLVLELTFPKSMRWADKKISFARPIQWFLAMSDNEIVNFEIEGIKSSNISYGHRFFGTKFQVDNADDYFKKIRQNNVIIDVDERKELIRKLIKEKSISGSENVVIDENLLNEVTNLVEYPYPIVGSFNPSFLEVPQEVLIISMQVHQRYFPILDKENKLLPKFIVIRNGISDSELVREGNEKVLSARLADARFFYQEDLKIPLIKNVEKLKSVVFQKDLGTIYQKLERMQKIASFLIKKMNLESKKDTIDRTILLAKADLVSNMIGEKEFTKLQGFMGADYAEKNGEKEEVCIGIREHYYPRFQGDALPSNLEGAITAISDKLDTLVGCFGVGLKPSGSKDPFALRRAALGILNIIINSKIDVSLDELVDASLDSLAETGVLKEDRDSIKSEILEFFKQRLINIFSDMNFDKDIISSVFEINFEDIFDTLKKVKSVTNFYKIENSPKIAELTTRIDNIASKHEISDIIPNLFQNDFEEKLYELSLILDAKTDEFIKSKDYENYLKELLVHVDFINEYFNNVMIMDENIEFKKNRLNQIKSIYNIFTKIAKL